MVKTAVVSKAALEAARLERERIERQNNFNPLASPINAALAKEDTVVEVKKKRKFKVKSEKLRSIVDLDGSDNDLLIANRKEIDTEESRKADDRASEIAIE